MRMNWNGVFTAVTTKFTSQDELDLPLFISNLKKQVQAGVSGIIIGGSLGEASVLTFSEKEQLVQAALKADFKVPILLNIAEGATRDAIQQAKAAEQWGMDGLMVLPPMRYSSDARETTEFFSAVAAATDLPIMIYNNPVDYKVQVTIEMFEWLLDKHPTIEAVKESTRDVTNITRLKNKCGDRLKILCGVDTLAFESFCAGADGWVAGLVNAFPTETVRLHQLVQQGRIEEARSLYRWFMPLLELDIHPKLVQYIKLAETVVGTGSEHVRAPRLKLEGEERNCIMKIIQMAIDHRPEFADYEKAGV